MLLALTSSEWTNYGLQFLVVVLIAFGVLTLLTSHLRFQRLTKLAQSGDIAMDAADAMQIQVMHRLGAAARDPAPFAVILLEFKQSEKLLQRLRLDEPRDLLAAAESVVRGCVRVSDFVCVFEEQQLGLVVDAGIRHAPMVLQRMLDQLNQRNCRLPSGERLPLPVRAGVAVFPKDGDRAPDLLETARTRLAEARAQDLDVAFPATEAPAETGPEAASGGADALLDPLTGILRADRVPGMLQKFVARYRKDDLPVSLLYIDVDHLKRYNEHYTERAGDRILKDLAHLLEGHVRIDDLIGRYDGEEFLIAMSCKAEQALEAAHRLLGEVKSTHFPHGSTKLKITVSIGVAGCPDHARVASKLFDAAAAALYAAKLKGRGYAVMYQPGMHSPPEEARRASSF